METLDDLLRNLSSATAEEAFILTIGQFIDLAMEQKSISHIEQGIFLLEEWLPKVNTSKNKVLCHYFLAVAWEDKRAYYRHKKTSDWDWEQEEIEHALINLRLAEKYFQRIENPKVRYLQILTNLGNILDSLGRPIPALSYWNQVINFDRKFGMALANKGACLIYHGFNSVPDLLFKRFYLRLGYEDLIEGITYPIEPAAAQDFKQRVESIKSIYPDIQNWEIHLHENLSKLETNYTNWCIQNVLFLNPIIDVHTYDFATWDNAIVALPDKELDNFLAQIICEFRIARRFFYRSVSEKSISFEYNENIEHKKLSFRIAYSIFDKIAYLINKFYVLKIPNTKVNFHTLWFLDLKKDKGLRPEFINNDNLFLRGLYWISKDLFYAKEGFKNALTPEAKEIAKLRNFIEHKSFTVDAISGKSDFTYSISVDDFDFKILNLLKMSRESILNFIYSVERKRIMKK